ncbi:hypothetical protein GCM10007148_05920 [Parvularcula lutaonensis]|nr:hypothetical protein GCM10007148_05920 [Parvularcula lutaonensis]
MVSLVRTQDEWLIAIACETGFELFYLNDAKLDYRRRLGVKSADDVAVIMLAFADGDTSWSQGFEAITADEIIFALGEDEDEVAGYLANLPAGIALLVAFAVDTPLGFGTILDAFIEGAAAGLIGGLGGGLAAGVFQSNLPKAVGYLAVLFAIAGSVGAFLALRWFALGLVG